MSTSSTMYWQIAAVYLTFSAWVYFSSPRKGVFQNVCLCLISICLLDKYIPFLCKKKKKRWGSAVMLKRLHPHVELLYTMFMYDCTFCANWYRMITSVSSEKAADMCVQSICLLMMQCNYVTRKTILYVTHIKLF